ncbi:MAG: hypothetical protein K0R55_4201 [Sporomusa sp.]|nr:hypothetical protein [Sporomusa sp.]
MDVAINSNTLVAQVMDLLAAEIDGETIMLNIENGMYYQLDVTGSRIWDLLGEQRRVSELISNLVEEYNVQPEQCCSDTLKFIREIWDEGLVRLD